MKTYKGVTIERVLHNGLYVAAGGLKADTLDGIKWLIDALPENRRKIVARKLNAHHRAYGAGFYWAHGGRYYKARVRDGVLEVNDWETWTRVPDDKIKFHDHNGRNISL